MSKVYNSKSGILKIVFLVFLIIAGTLAIGVLVNRNRLISIKSKASDVSTSTITDDPDLKTAIILYKADFTKYWRTISAAGSKIIRIYNEGSLVAIEIDGGSLSDPLEGSLYIPYNLPTSHAYTTSFDAKLMSGYSDYNAWIRIGINQQLPNGSYVIGIHPSTQAWTVDKYVSGVGTNIGMGTNTSIKVNNSLNKIKIYRNPVNGLTKIYVNNSLITNFTDKTFVGGVNRLFLSAYTSGAKVQFSNYTISK